MRVLFVGDIVGAEATHWLAERVPQLRRELQLDLVIVNAENCAVTGPSPMTGFGMTCKLVEHLVESGVDAITGGNHSWDGPEVESVLAHPWVIRPFNVSDAAPGRGVVTLSVGEERATIVNILSPTASLPGQLAPRPALPWPAWQSLVSNRHLPEPVIVDFHGDSVWEKAAFAMAVDGEIAAVLGTHTHDPTARCHLLPGGTALVAEVGMTGRLGWTGGGFNPIHFAASLRGDDPNSLPPYELARGEMSMGAVLLKVESGKTVAIQRVS